MGNQTRKLQEKNWVGIRRVEEAAGRREIEGRDYWRGEEKTAKRAHAQNWKFQ